MRLGKDGWPTDDEVIRQRDNDCNCNFLAAANERIQTLTVENECLSASCKACADQYAAANERIKELKEQLQAEVKLRPLWAQGYTSDSVAAQVSTGALHGLWELLGVENQTDAIAKLTTERAISDKLEKALRTAEALLYGHGKPVDQAITTALAEVEAMRKGEKN